MPTEVLTVEDLSEFKIELLEDIKNIIKENDAITPKKYIKNTELGKLLNVSVATLQTLRTNGTFPFIKVGGIIFYEAEEIKKIMKENKIHYNY